MKYNLWIVLALDCFLMQTAASELAEAERIEHQQVQIWEAKLESARNLESEEKIEILHRGLRKMGWRCSFPNHSVAVDEIYRKIQAELLSTPGHARTLVEQMEESLSHPKNPGHDHQRSWILRETLPHLPSPETIWVLGHYLGDERHTRDPSLCASGDIGPNSMLATTGLRRMGLRESEDLIRTQGYTMSLLKDLESCRRWWEEVKSGERAFSFKGQDVEYRFNPDGTWETIPIANPPDDGPKPTKVEPATPPAREAPAEAAEPADQETPAATRRIWVVIAALLVAGCSGFLILRKQKT